MAPKKGTCASDDRRLHLAQMEKGMVVELVDARGGVNRFEVTAAPTRTDDAEALAQWREEPPGHCLWLDSLSEKTGVAHMIGAGHLIPTLRRFGQKELPGLEPACDLGLEPCGPGGGWHQHHYVRQACDEP